MEFFRTVNIDWMGKAKYFVTLSLVLLAIGWISVWKQGLRYGIDFRGGTLVDVRFATPPPVDRIRKGLQEAGLHNSTITPISDISDPNSKNDIQISLEQNGQSDQALDADRQAVLDALHKTFGTQTGNFAIRSVESVGPKVGAQLRQQAFWATMYALGGMLVYVAIRFSGGDLFLRRGAGVGFGAFVRRWIDTIIFGAAAVIACFHDVLITLGFFSLRHYEISLTVIAALLTLVGYSMNDTIVIFDRVRENLRLMRREPFPEIVNKSINQTLSRTILTSGLTLLTVLVLYIMGGEVLRAFSFAMVVGVVVGTYSSFGIAAPIVVVWNKYQTSRGATVRAGSAAEKRAVATARR
jgi:preprotein translocase subunit SecF